MSKIIALSFLVLSLLCCKSDPNLHSDQSKDDQALAEFDVSSADNYAKQVVLSCKRSDLQSRDSLVRWIIDFQPGGLWFNDWEIEEIQSLAKELDTLIDQKPLFFTDYFKQINLEPYPLWAANSSFRDSSFWRSFKSAGVNAVQFSGSILVNAANGKYFQKLAKEVGVFPVYNISIARKSIEDLHLLPGKLQKRGGFLWLDSLRIDSLPYHQIKKALDWQGLIVANPMSNHLHHLQAGADMVIVADRSFLSPSKYKQSPKSTWSYKEIKELIDRQKNGRYSQYSAKALLKSTQLHFAAKSTAILKQSKRTLPLKKWKEKNMEQYLSENNTAGSVIFVPEFATHSDLTNLSNHESAKDNVYLFNNVDQYELLRKAPNLVFCHKKTIENKDLLKAQLLGKIPISGNLVIEENIISGKKSNGSGLVNLPPEYVFIDSKMLGKINGLVNAAVEGGAFPGCQVYAIKNNVVIYNRSFGYTNSAKNELVKQSHLYDLASLTKVLATTLVGMKLWEDGYFKLDDVVGDYLPDSLKKYLPTGSTLKDITFQELLTHKSGLPAGFPVIRYMRKAADTEERFMNGFCDYPYSDFQTEVGENLYLENSFQDSMWITLNSLWVDPAKEFKYSDVNMNVLYFLFKHIISTKSLAKSGMKENDVFANYLYQNFYKRLAMETTRFKPLKYFSKSQIIPTENDRFWRKQLLQGHVHDPNAALYGGIAGNAGLFSTAADIGKLLAMWQNSGVFEGKRYLKAETIQKFSSAQPNTHRGLGFNKRTFTNAAYAMANAADESSYGHTGFTGTCFWVDPVNKISYVFLSNRVHPKVSRKIYEFNIRKVVHEVFYQALLK